MNVKLISYSALATLVLLTMGHGVAAENGTKFEQQVIDQTNSQRARYGLRPLALDTNLMQSSRNHCYWMAKNSTLKHSGQPVAENIAQGQSTATEAVNDWMNSPGHRANMLNTSYTRIGVSAWTGSNGQVFWCQQFLP